MSLSKTVFFQFIVRALLREKLRALLTILGVSLGVAVVVAIRLANNSALASFRNATVSLAGHTTLQITGSTGRFAERTLPDLAWLHAYGEVSPVIDGYALMKPTGTHEAGEARGVFLRVLGVDILRDLSLRDYRLLRLTASDRDPTAREFLFLLADAHAIIVTEKFARHHQLTVGSRLPLIIGDRQQEFTVRGLLRDEGPASALDGNFILMDIAAAQWAFDRIGWLDRLDLKLRPGLDSERTKQTIVQRLPPELVVGEPEGQYVQVENMIRVFHFNLNALASVALLIGMFLIYNTVSITVVTRRDEIGMLRAIGGTRRLIVALFVGEAVLLAGIGTGIGIGLGRLLADEVTSSTATTVETFYLPSAVAQTAPSAVLAPRDVGIAFLLALTLAVLAAVVPALEAAAVQPIEAIRGAERLGKSVRPSRWYYGVALCLAAVGITLSFLGPINGLPLGGYGAAVALMFAGAFCVPHTVWLVCRLWGRWLAPRLRLLPLEAALASANVAGAIPRIAISVAALSVSLAMMVAIAILIASFRETVVYWVEQTLRADIYARPVTRPSATASGEISVAATELVRRDPDVLAVDAFAAQSATYHDQAITLAAGDFDVLLTHGQLLFKAPHDATTRLRAAIGQDAVSVSESFALHFKKHPGDMIELPTVQGLRAFTIAAIFYDYSSQRGVVVMDRTTATRYFASLRPASLSIYLRAGANADRVRDRLAQNVGSQYQLVFAVNQSLRDEALRIFDRTFAITSALQVIALIVAALGVIITLLTLILERRREFALLSILGATRAQVRRMIVIEALYIGGVGQMIGGVIGFVLALVLVYVINVQSFGWTIQFHIPTIFLIQTTLLTLLAAGVAGLYPASRAAGMEAARLVREE